jgi:hypothetical protein
MKIEKLPSSNGGADGFSSTVHLMGGTIHAEIHVIAEEPPHRFVYECTDPAGHYRWTMTLRAVGTGTELTQSAERLKGPLWVRVIQPWLLWPLSGAAKRSQGPRQHQSPSGGLNGEIDMPAYGHRCQRARVHRL